LQTRFYFYFFEVGYNAPKFSYKIPLGFIFLKSYKITSKSGMRLEVLMENKINEKFVLKNESSLPKDFVDRFITVCKNFMPYLDKNRYFAVVIGDVYKAQLYA
jgi:hypothetical protein